MNKFYSVVLVSIFLSACGGGSSETTAVQSPQNTVIGQSAQVISVQAISYPSDTIISLVESSPTNSKVSQEIIVSTAKASRDIAVPNDFPLNSERLLTFTVKLSEADSQAAYISLCSDYSYLSDSSYRINYDSCLLRTSLDSHIYETAVSVTNDTTGLVAALWFLDKSKAPLIKDWRFQH